MILSESLKYMDKDSTLRTIASILKRSGITDKVTIIGKAKVPIVKFITNHGECWTEYNDYPFIWPS